MQLLVQLSAHWGGSFMYGTRFPAKKHFRLVTH
jgi:hypothetical protein